MPVYYDPLVAKVITWGATRDEALARMLRALEEYAIEGIETTIPFHIWVMRDENFRRGSFNTSYIDQHYTAKAGEERRKVPVDVAVIAATIAHLQSRSTPAHRPASTGSRWKDAARKENTRRGSLRDR